MKTIEERFTEWKIRSSAIARELNLEIEFTTHMKGGGYMSYESPCAEVTSTDPYQYLLSEGRTEIG